MISQVERVIALRYLKPKKKEGFLKVISVFSFTGIALGVAILIIVMSVMNGFRTELINKIVGFNAHMTVKPYDISINIDKVDDAHAIAKNMSTAGWLWGPIILKVLETYQLYWKYIIFRGMDIAKKWRARPELLGMARR